MTSFSMTLNDPLARFQGRGNFRTRISSKRLKIRP